MVTFIHRGISGLFIMAMFPDPHPVYPSCASRECTNLGILGQGNVYIVYQSDVIFSPAHDTRMTHDNQRGSHLFDCTAAVMLLSCCQLTDVTVCMSPCYPVMLSCCDVTTSCHQAEAFLAYVSSICLQMLNYSIGMYSFLFLFQ